MGKRLFIIWVVAAVLLLGFSSTAFTEELVVLYTNDTHSKLFSFGDHDQYGGIARMSTMIKHLRAENGNVVAVHAGDVSVGSFAFNKYLGYPSFKIMEGLYDAMALGNHDFDLGPVVLGYVLAGYDPVSAQTLGPPVALPILSANVDLSSYPMLGSFVSPSMIEEVGDLKVGMFGVITNDPVYYSPSFYGIFEDPYVAAAVTAAGLRAAGCDVVIAISHLGLAYDVLGLSAIPGIDVIVSAHSHDVLFAPDINGKVIVQAGEMGLNLGELRLDVDGGVSVVSNEFHPIVGPLVRKDPSLLGYLNDLRDGIYEDPRFWPVYSEYVAKAMWDLEEKWTSGDPNRDTPLGNLVADAIRTGVENAGYPVDFAIEGNAYIGHKIYAGKVVGNDVMAVVPYGFDPATGLGFKMKVVTLYGLEVLGSLEYSVHMAEYVDDYSIQVSGLTFAYDSSLAPYSRLDLSSVKVNGVPIEPYSLYAVAMSEQMVALLESLGLDLTGRVTDLSPDLFEFNLVKDYMGQLNHLAYTAEGRIIDTALMP